MTIINQDEEERLEQSRQLWDEEATSFDNEPDHGLRDPVVLATWTALLQTELPPPPATILDIGCGTGSLSLVMAHLGHHVTGVDLSPAMIAQAQQKASAAGLQIPFHVMDASRPDLAGQQFDVILCRHLLWALPSPATILQSWYDLLATKGRFLLIEGYWETGAGLHAEEVVAALPSAFTSVKVLDLGQQPNFWGKTVNDERYSVTAKLE